MTDRISEIEERVRVYNDSRYATERKEEIEWQFPDDIAYLLERLENLRGQLDTCTEGYAALPL